MNAIATVGNVREMLILIIPASRCLINYITLSFLKSQILNQQSNVYVKGLTQSDELTENDPLCLKFAFSATVLMYFSSIFVFFG